MGERAIEKELVSILTVDDLAGEAAGSSVAVALVSGNLPPILDLVRPTEAAVAQKLDVVTGVSRTSCAVPRLT